MFQFAKLDMIFWLSLGIDINFEVIRTYATQFKRGQYIVSEKLQKKNVNKVSTTLRWGIVKKRRLS